MNLELPHDWGALKRSQNSGASSGLVPTTGKAAGSKWQHELSNHVDAVEAVTQEATVGGQRSGKGAGPSAAKKSTREDCDAARKVAGEGESTGRQQVLRVEKCESITTGMEPEPCAGESLVQPSLLGPRTLFNPITHDAPEKGQLKQIVLAQLSKKSKSAPNQPGNNGSKRSSGEGGANHNPLEVNCLLSKVPYQKMLSDLFMHQDREILPSPNIPYVTRTYEESFMREPLNGSERLCAKQENCECMFLDKEQPFVAVEFLLPGERPPATPHLCVVCCRAVTQQLYYDIMFDKQDFGGVIQRFGNIHSQPGEYALDAMLIAAPNVALHIMPLPIVSHQRNRYSVVVKRGIKHLKQNRVYFQYTPSC